MILNGHAVHIVMQLSQNVLSGVYIPQGTAVFGPLLIPCYINDLPNNVTSRVKLYADGVLLYSPVNSR